MRIFYDTEFLEDGHTLSLISIGMVREDGKELYLINESIDQERLKSHPWLMKHVVKPHLPITMFSNGNMYWDREHRDYPLVMPKKDIAHRVWKFTEEVGCPSLWAWYGAYDHVALAQLWGPMSQMPQHLPYMTLDVRQEHLRLGEPTLPKQLKGTSHHALHDARWVRDAHDFLQGEGRR